MQSTKIKNSDVKQQKWKFTKTFPVGEWHRQNFHRMQTYIQFETCEQMHISCVQIINVFHFRQTKMPFKIWSQADSAKYRCQQGPNHPSHL